MSKTFAVIQATRFPFLILAPVCIFLGVSVAAYSETTLGTIEVLLLFVAGLLAHVSVNMLNEYSDFRSGLDFNTTKTPFSGGSGALPANPGVARLVLVAGAGALIVTGLIGAYFVHKCGLQIIPAGLAGMVLIVVYTDWVNRHPLLCLISPGSGFGLLMVAGTCYILAGSNLAAAWLAALVPFFLVNNLLLLNQFPDMEADAGVGRKSFPIAYGTTAASRIYLGFSLAAMLGILAGVVAGFFPVLSLIALLPAPLAVFAYTGAIRHGREIGQHPQYLGANVVVTLLMPLLLGLSLVVV